MMAAGAILMLLSIVALLVIATASSIDQVGR